MIIEHSDKQEHINCPNCFWDISQEEIDAMHCNNCNKDMQILSKIIYIPAPDPVPDSANTSNT
jgi:hypothetical protein